MSSYLDHFDRPTEGHKICIQTLSWRRFTERRLEWIYGLERAYAIRTGRDAATQADLARWNALGNRSAA